jgi:oxygen tolerance protein BatD
MRMCGNGSDAEARRIWAGRFLTVFVLWGSGVMALAQPNLTAKLDRQNVPLGESVTLSLIFSDTSPGDAPNLPAIPNVKVAPSVSTSQSVSIFNGVRSQSVTFDYVLIPLQIGEITIPKIEVNVGGRTLASQPLKLKVLKANAALASPSGQETIAFLKLVVPKTQIYVGEAVPVEIQLYAVEGRLLRLPQLQGEGFTVGKMSDAAMSRTRANNQIYQVATFKTFVVPAKIGALSLGPVTVDVAVPDFSRRPDIFGFRPQRQATLTSEPQPIEVLALPVQNVPASFSGAVGNYTLELTAAPTEVAVGDPITVRVRITGSGLLDALTLPAQPDWREFKLYPPTGKVEATDAIGLSGVKTFEQVVVPQNAEIKSLPPLAFSFFDPDQKMFRTLSSKALALTVRPGSASPVVPTNFAQTAEPSAPPPPQDIVHIKPRLGEFASSGVPLVQQRWFLAIQGVPVLLWLSLLARRKYLESLAANPRLRRQKEVVRTVRAGLRDLRRLAAANQSEEFFAALFRLLQEQLGERLDLPASAITEAVIDERLQEGKLSPDAVASLHELFQSCNMARYARHNSQELATLVPRVEQALRDLQNMKP